MQAWIEFYIVLGKIFFVILVAILVAIILCLLGKWLDKSGEADKQIQPKVYGIYDSKGKMIERRMVHRRSRKGREVNAGKH